MEGLIDGHWRIMGEEDPEHSVKLVVDEWGPWYKPGSEATPGDQLEQMPTLRDAVFQRYATLESVQSPSGKDSYGQLRPAD